MKYVRRAAARTLVAAAMVYLWLNAAGIVIYGDAPVMVTTSEELTKAALEVTDNGIIMLGGDINAEQTVIFTCLGINAALDLNGHNLIVTDPKQNAIRMAGTGGSLTICDSKGTGQLTAGCGADGAYNSELNDSAGIRVAEGQKLIIDGATVSAAGGAYGAGLGASACLTGDIIIRSGKVTAAGGIYGAGIGGGYGKPAGNIIIEGGTVSASGGDFASGIGAGGYSEPIGGYQADNQVIITGGSITAQGGVHGAGLGGGQFSGACVKIEDGLVVASGGLGGAGIGTGKYNAAGVAYETDMWKHDLNVNISGGNIKATGGDFAAGIGTGEGDIETDYALCERLIRVTGGNIIARGGACGAGLGGGAFVSGGAVEILNGDGKNVYVEAEGGKSGAGLGGGMAGAAGSAINIYDGAITLTGGAGAAGLGSGEYSLNNLEPTDSFHQSLKNISIYGGDIKITAGEGAAAIGGGSCGSGAYVSIAGFPIITAESSHETTIGAGAKAVSHGTLTIDSGNIKVSHNMGARPVNSRGEPVYPGEIAVLTDTLGQPVANALITAEVPGAYTYPATADKEGKAYLYLPNSIEPCFIRVGAQDRGFEYEGYMAFAPDTVATLTAELTERIPLSIMSTGYTYYVDSGDNTYQVAYTGGLGDISFALAGDENQISISSEGLMTFPVQLKPGDYSFTVNAYEGRALADSIVFDLKVRETLKSLAAVPKTLELLPSARQVLMFDAGDYADIQDVSWKVTSGDEANCLLEDLYPDSGEYMALFTALKPGRFTVTVSAKDNGANLAGDTIDITVLNIVHTYEEETAEVFWSDSVPLDELFGEIGPKIEAWSVFRHSSLRASIEFEANKTGVYRYRLALPGQEPEGEYKEGPAFKGRNAINLPGLTHAGAQVLYIELVDERGAVSPEIRMEIPAYVLSDIMPPQITDVTVETDEDTGKAYVRFSSDKTGSYSYTAYEDGIVSVSLVRPFVRYGALNTGANEIALDGISATADTELRITAEDEAGNIGRPVSVIIPARREETAEAVRPTTVPAPDEVKPSAELSIPKLSSPDVTRTGSSAAVIRLTSNKYGVFEYTLTEISDNPSKGKFYTALMTAGENVIFISGLSPYEGYSVCVTPKDENGVAGEAVNAVIPVEKPVISLKEKESARQSINRAAVVFESDKDGTLFYSIVPHGEDMSGVYEYSDVVYTGRNVIVFDSLFSSKPVDVYVMGKDDDGNFSNILKFEVDGYK